jgi:hypothetical protein
MSELSASPASRGWYRRFVEHLDPGERLGELLFGLIMVLTFTLGAGIELQGDRTATRELLIAALGCNAAWGIIDAALYLMSAFERGRLHRLVKRSRRRRRVGLVLVDRELTSGCRPSRPEVRAALDAHVLDRARAESREPSPRRTWGRPVFWLVFPRPAMRLPRAARRIATRASNALIGLLFYVGWRWADYTGASRLGTALFIALLSVALVAVAIALGG